MNTLVLLLILNNSGTYEYAQFEGPNAMLRCELTKELLLESLTNTPITSRLECQHADV